MKSDFSHGRNGLRIRINDLGLIYIQHSKILNTSEQTVFAHVSERIDAAMHAKRLGSANFCNRAGNHLDSNLFINSFTIFCVSTSATICAQN